MSRLSDLTRTTVEALGLMPEMLIWLDALLGGGMAFVAETTTENG